MQNLLRELLRQQQQAEFRDESFSVVDAIRAEIFEPQYKDVASYLDPTTNETTDLPPYWQLPVTDDMKLNATLTFVAAISSLIMSIIVVSLYVKAIFVPSRKKYRLARIANPHNHFIFFIQVSAIFSSLMFIMTSTLRLWGSPRTSYLWCDTSFAIMQIFGEPQCFLEIFFLVSILVSINKPNWLPRQTDSSDVPPFVFYSSCTAYLISVSACFFCALFLPINPQWGSRGDPSLAVWCWIPSKYPNENEDSPILVAAQFLTYNTWAILCPIVGIITVIQGLRAVDQPTDAVKSFFFFRTMYSLAFALVWFPVIVSRVLNTPNSAIHSIQAFCEPFLPFINGVIFIVSEVMPRMNKHKVFNGANLGVAQLTSTRHFIDPSILMGTGQLQRYQELQEPQSIHNINDSPVATGDLPTPGNNNNNNSSRTQQSRQFPFESSSDDDDDDDDDEVIPQSALPSNAASFVTRQRTNNFSERTNKSFSANKSRPRVGVSAGSATRIQTSSTNSNNINNGSIVTNVGDVTQSFRDGRDSEMNGEETEEYGVHAVMNSLTNQDRIQLRDEAQVDNIKVVFDEITQSWSIEIDPNADVSAESVLAKLQAVKFLQVDAYIHGAILSFLCGFGDLTGGALLKFYTAHVTGNIASWALYIGGFETKVGLLRHGWGYLVYMVGAGVTAELFRRFKKKDNGARFLLFWTWFFLITAFVCAKTHQKIGTADWDDSSASWLSSFSMVFAYSAVNVYQRVANAGPIFSLQTGNTTAICGDIMLFIFDCPKEKEAKKVILRRIRGNFLNIGFFTLGGIASSVSASHKAELCFLVPALLSTVVLWLGWGVHSSS